MNELKLLVKLQFDIFWGGIKYGKKRRRRTIGGGVLVAVLALVLLVSMGFSAYGSLLVYRQVDLEWAMFYPGQTLTILLLLLVAMARSAGSSRINDAEMLLSLPLSRTNVLLAKSLSKYLFDLAMATVVFLPYTVVYLIFVEFSLPLLLRALLVLLLLPLLSVGFASLLSYLLFRFGSLVRNPQGFSSVVTILLLVVYMLFAFTMNSQVASAEEALAAMDSFPPAAWGASFLSQGDVRSLLLLLVLTLLPFGVGVRLYAQIFGRKQRSFRSRSTKLEFRLRSPRAALLAAESRRYFSSSVYLVNTIFGLVMMAACTVALVVLPADSGVMQMIAMPEFQPLLPLIMTAVYSFFPTTCYISASSISIEGKSIWLLRSLPLAATDVFRVKIGFNILIVAPVTLVCSLTAALILGLDAIGVLITALLPTLTAVLTSCLGLVLNLLYPKLDWDEEARVVKQSMAATLALFLNFFLVGLPAAISFIWLASRLTLAAVAGLWTLFYLVIMAGLVLYLRTGGVRRFEQLS